MRSINKFLPKTVAYGFHAISWSLPKHFTFIQLIIYKATTLIFHIITLYLLSYPTLSRLLIIPSQVAVVLLGLPIISRLSANGVCGRSWQFPTLEWLSMPSPLNHWATHTKIVFCTTNTNKLVLRLFLVEPVGVEPTIVHVAALPIAYSPI